MILTIYLSICSYSPALKATAKKLNMSEHLAGVTLLAFGNSTSDLIGYMKSSGISTLFTYMVSNAIFITLISGGLVCVLCPTHFLQFETMRTMLFFILTVMITEYALSHNETGAVITIKDSICNVFNSLFILHSRLLREYQIFWLFLPKYYKYYKIYKYSLFKNIFQYVFVTQCYFKTLSKLS